MITTSLATGTPALAASPSVKESLKSCVARLKDILTRGVKGPTFSSTEALKVGQFQRDENGMPISLTDTHDPQITIKFFWKASKIYQREIYALRLDLAKANSGVKTLLTQNENQIFGYQLPDDIKLAFDQVRSGGNKFRAEQSVGDYLAHYPVENYDRSTNILLTKNYGAEFAGAVYKFLRDNQPDNKWAKKTMLDFIARGDSNGFSLAENFKGTKLLIAKGYLDGPKTSPSLPLAAMLIEKGVDVEYFDTDSAAPVDKNASVIAKNLEERLRRGEKVIIWGLSKGVTEILGALTQIQKIVDNVDGTVPGRVEAVLSTSGVVGGSFIADWGIRYPQFAAVNLAIRKFAVGEGVPMAHVRRALRTLGAGYVKNYLFKENEVLPQNPVYLEISGVSSDNFGYTADPGLRGLQKNLFDTPFFPDHFANDGFLEYPGTEIPRQQVKHLYQLTFNSSHRIMDGTYEGYPMTDPDVRNTVLSSIFRFIFVAINR